jgi:transmembrane sensor
MTQSNQRIDEEAAGWVVRQRARALAAEEQAELDCWLQADVRHRGALLRARAAWVDLDRLAALAAHREPPHVAESQARSGETRARAGAGGAWQLKTRRWFVAAGLTALTLGGAGAWLVRRRGDVYVSDVGEIRQVTLADGSRMVLNTATEATVRFDKAYREIELSAGEGLFQVAKDPKRPFIVRAGSVSVRAVGTVFAVRTIDQRVDVTVTEGVVELVEDSGSARGLIGRIGANEHATVMEKSEVEVRTLPQDQAERRLAWREGLVDFDGEPLNQAVDEINRHNHRHIVVDDADLAARPVVGLFRANDPDGFALTVSIALGAQSITQADAIHLRRRSNP